MINRIIEDSKIKMLRSYLDMYDNIVITCHTSPDGDAIGSSLAMFHILSKLNKVVNVITPDSMPSNLKFMNGRKDIVVYDKYPDFATRLVNEAQLIICLDFNAPKRMSTLADLIVGANAKRVLIDHHLDPADFCDLVISYPQMSSTCELLFRVLCRLELFNEIDKVVAESLYTGMMTDTGNFSYNSNNTDLYIIVSELVKRGVDKDAIYTKAMNSSSEGALRLRGYAISEKMRIDKDSNTALITLSRSELQRFKYRRGDTEGLVNMPLAIADVNRVIFMREDEELVKISARSTGEFPVNTICSRYFNGGGHKNASGGEFYGTLDEAIEVYNEIIDEIKNEKKTIK